MKKLTLLIIFNTLPLPLFSMHQLSQQHIYSACKEDAAIKRKNIALYKKFLGCFKEQNHISIARCNALLTKARKLQKDCLVSFCLKIIAQTDSRAPKNHALWQPCYNDKVMINNFLSEPNNINEVLINALAQDSTKPLEFVLQQRGVNLNFIFKTEGNYPRLMCPGYLAIENDNILQLSLLLRYGAHIEPNDTMSLLALGLLKNKQHLVNFMVNIIDYDDQRFVKEMFTLISTDTYRYIPLSLLPYYYFAQEQGCSDRTKEILYNGYMKQIKIRRVLYQTFSTK